jgi:hypothetical protein
VKLRCCSRGDYFLLTDSIQSAFRNGWSLLVDIQIFSGVKLAQALEPARAKRSVSWLANTSRKRGQTTVSLY